MGRCDLMTAFLDLNTLVCSFRVFIVESKYGFAQCYLKYYLSIYKCPLYQVHVRLIKTLDMSELILTFLFIIQLNIYDKNNETQFS